MAYCAHCEGYIAKDAKTCRHCGTFDPKGNIISMFWALKFVFKIFIYWPFKIFVLYPIKGITVLTILIYEKKELSKFLRIIILTLLYLTIIVIFYFVFINKNNRIQNINSQKISFSKKENIMVSIEKSEIYVKPNDKSIVKLIANAGQEFEVTKRTKFFAEVKFITNDSLRHKGYIKLKKLKEK